MFSQARRRIAWIRGLFLGGCLLLAGRLVLLQVWEHGYWSYQGFLNREKVLPRPVRRGAILDRTGRPLTKDEGSHDVEVVFLDFRRGNALGQAFHLKLLVLPPPILDPEDWLATSTFIEQLDRKVRLEKELEQAEDPVNQSKLAAELAEQKEWLAKARRPTLPDTRPISLAWARENLDELTEFVVTFGSEDLPDPARIPRPVSGAGPSWEDLRQGARIARGQARWYLTRLIAGALEGAGSEDPAGRAALAEWRRQGGGSLERWLRRRWREEIDGKRSSVPSFAAFFGVDRPAMFAHLERGLQALSFADSPGRDALARFDQIHLRNVRLIAYPFLNEWPLWDRAFRNTLRFHEDRREPLWRNVPFDVVRRIALSPRAHQGFVVVDSVRRSYPAEIGRDWTPAARILGRVTGAFREDLDQISTDTGWLEAPLPGLEEFWLGYRRGVERRTLWQKVGFMRFGREGLEALLDRQLAGEEGWRMVQTDRRARLRGGEAPFRKLERPGRDVRTTLDLDLQVALESALARIERGDESVQAGAALVDCRNGDVLALASSPLVRHIDLDQAASEVARGQPYAVGHASLVSDDWSLRIPRFSPPGSTFKVVTAVAALRAGLAGEQHCPGSLSLPWGRIGCEGVHGGIHLERALEVSCNVYFGRLGLKLGVTVLAEEAARLGFGPGWSWQGPELRGDPPAMEAVRGATVARQAIGYHAQATPLAMARVYAAIATGVLRPLRILAEEPLAPEESLGLVASDLARIQEGLRLVVSGRAGTARRYGLAEFEVAAKTGTAQLRSGGGGPNNAWFAGYVPHSRPLLAFAVLAPGVPHGRHGGGVAAPVVADFLRDPVVREWIRRKGGGR